MIDTVNNTPPEITKLVKCITLVDQHYITVMGKNLSNEIYQQAAENAFTAEFYHQIRCNFNLEIENLQVHFDLNKQRANAIRPDLVIHHSPSDRNDQRLYIEVKTNPNTSMNDFVLDIQKLIRAVKPNNGSNHLGFKMAVYVVANSEIIYQAIKRNHSYLFDKIFLITFNSSEFVPKLENFHKICSD